jgi:hypothetical protein
MRHVQGARSTLSESPGRRLPARAFFFTLDASCETKDHRTEPIGKLVCVLLLVAGYHALDEQNVEDGSHFLGASERYRKQVIAIVSGSSHAFTEVLGHRRQGFLKLIGQPLVYSPCLGNEGLTIPI